MPTIANAPLFVSSLSERFSASGTGIPGVVSTTVAATLWPAANRAVYVPFVLPFDYHAARAYWANGGGPTGNADLAIYSAISLARLFSTGSTPRAGATASQFVNTDWYIPAGKYYMGLVTSNNTGSVLAATFLNITFCRLAGLLQETSALPLPSTMTPAVVTTAFLPLFGITRMAAF